MTTRNTTLRSDLFQSLADDIGCAIKPFDVKILMLMLPDLAESNGVPVKINQTHLAQQLRKPTPQVTRSVSSLKKAGYLVQHERRGVSFTYTLNPMFQATEVYDAIAIAKGSLPKPLPPAPEPIRIYGGMTPSGVPEISHVVKV